VRGEPSVKRFAQLFRELDQTTRTSERLSALVRYFREADGSDAVWALHFLLGRRGRRPIKTSLLRDWVADESGYPFWLVEECYDKVGDLAETLALLLEGRHSCRPVDSSSLTNDAGAPPLHALITERLLPLAALPEPEQRRLLLQTLRSLDPTGRFLYLKLLTGGFRMGVSKILVIRALAEAAGLSRAVMEHRLMGRWDPTAADFHRLLDANESRRDAAQPYPFYLASPIEQNVEPNARLADWQIEWKWDGIRAQLIRRDGQSILWSRGEELITHGYPEIVEAAAALPDGTVLDGELLAWRDDAPLPFNELQKRLGRKSVSAKIRLQVPVAFIAYDLLENDTKDIRPLPLRDRRQQLETIIAQAAKDFRQLPTTRPRELQGELFARHDSTTVAEPAFPIRLSPLIDAADMEALAARRAESRLRGNEGVMLKRRDSGYGVGRERGAWWKWKVDPHTVDAVLIAAQPGHGKRAGLFTDYTFAIWRNDELVSFAKAYSGLTADEIQEVDEWVRANTTGRHGPVRTVTPELVFELAFEGIQESARHKSGIALRFPRIARWRKDKPVKEADRIESLEALFKRP
jgi:DNA ligase-1